MNIQELQHLSITAEAIREMSDGAWFLLTLSLTIIFIWYSWSWISRVRWPWNRATQAAIALSIYFLGSTIRSGFLWLQWISINNDLGLDFWKNPQTEILVALALCIIGGTLSVSVFVPEQNRFNIQASIILSCFIIPVLVYFLV